MEVISTTIKLIFELLAIATASNYIALSPPVQWIRFQKWKYLKALKKQDIPYYLVRIKPFDCESCLSFWLTLIVMIATGQGIFAITILPFTAAYIAFKIPN